MVAAARLRGSWLSSATQNARLPEARDRSSYAFHAWCKAVSENSHELALLMEL